eukprot:238063_1
MATVPTLERIVARAKKLLDDAYKSTQKETIQLQELVQECEYALSDVKEFDDEMLEESVHRLVTGRVLFITLDKDEEIDSIKAGTYLDVSQDALRAILNTI